MLRLLHGPDRLPHPLAREPLYFFVADGRTCLEAYPFQRGGPRVLIPLVIARVAAGFPSPADDYVEGRLDLNDYCIEHEEATFFVRAMGTSMVRAGIGNGDLLVVDRAIEARPGNVVVAVVNGEHTVKRLVKRGGRLYLVAEPEEGEEYPPIAMAGEGEFLLWGVVTNVVKTMPR